jgi:formylglycine-generating enzyme required for sulfatase activity
MKMRWIPAGHFLIGAGADDKEDSHDEKPQHEVAISRGFWMGQTPVTQGQYLAVMGDNPSYFTEAGLEAPVEQVTWFEAAAFANKLSALEGASESFVRSGEEMDGLGNKESDYVGSNGWRLPTEAEWEYACRAGRTTLGYGDLEKIAWWDENSGETTHAVGQKQANAWGLHDMLGNVWEWCYDWHEADPRQAATDPVVAAAGMYRVLRGGCWDDHAYFVRLAPRGHNPPTGRYSAVGFRVVRLGLQSGLEVSSSTEPE